MMTVMKNEVAVLRIDKVPEPLVLNNVFPQHMEADKNCLLHEFEACVVAYTVKHVDDRVATKYVVEFNGHIQPFI